MMLTKRLLSFKINNQKELFRFFCSSNNTLETIKLNQIQWPKEYSDSPLEPNVTNVSTISPALRPTFNLAAYVNESYSLQQLVKLGVELYKFDSNPKIMETILKLDFERDMKPYIRFIHDIGVPTEEMGKFFTKNPLLFAEHMDDLITRINYLEHKNFNKEMITTIIRKHPQWLSHSTVDIDTSLGFFQNKFYLSGDNVRNLVTKLPKLITWPKKSVNLIMFSLNEEMGFNRSERKRLLLIQPKLYTMSKNHLLQRFDYIHNTMNINHDRIVLEPQVLSCRLFRIKQRHEYLKYLNRVQYDPTKPNYVSLLKLVSGTDSEFCLNIAKTSVEMFNSYLKTIQ
ncbi:Transcription termination factor, mitochondrial/chloroplastic [Cinara cedri]|uniref:Transcription termination factor 3, mitochondrial n=1 Tax=Cinara cedri TaxID=506608 RepID=A0A5E4LZE1_9HEMI|nr:Transcription termination factor, mitochondrial/chloroplastic [Cinara cedri]